MVVEALAAPSVLFQVVLVLFMEVDVKDSLVFCSYGDAVAKLSLVNE